MANGSGLSRRHRLCPTGHHPFWPTRRLHGWGIRAELLHRPDLLLGPRHQPVRCLHAVGNRYAGRDLCLPLPSHEEVWSG